MGPVTPFILITDRSETSNGMFSDKYPRVHEDQFLRSRLSLLHSPRHMKCHLPITSAMQSKRDTVYYGSMTRTTIFLGSSSASVTTIIHMYDFQLSQNNSVCSKFSRRHCKSNAECFCCNVWSFDTKSAASSTIILELKDSQLV
jgi:hypothetical protein